MMLLQKVVKFSQVHAAFERVYKIGDLAFRNDQIDRLCLVVFDVGPRGIKVGIAGDNQPGLGNYRKQDPFSRSTLVGWDDVLEAGDIANSLLEPEKTPAAGIRFIPNHHGAPLAIAHRAGSAIGQIIDQNILGPNHEEIVFGRFENGQPLLRRSP